MDLLKQKRKALTILLIFWILIGITSTIIYNLEWFIQKVVLFNGWLSSDLLTGEGKFGNGQTLVFADYNITDIHSFYDQLKIALQNNQSNTLTMYYDARIGSAFQIEGLLFAGAGLFAAFVSGPIIVFAINKKKKYRIILLPILLVLSLSMFVIMPIVSTLFLLIFVFTPFFAVLYGYRTAMDPWATSIARKTNVKIAFVRGFYEVGAAIGAIVMTQVFLNLNFYQKIPSYANGLPYYIIGIFLIILIVFLAILMPDNAFEEAHLDEKHLKISEKKLKEFQKSIDINKNITWKQIVKSKNFIIGLIVFLLLLGTVQAFNSIWVNTVENLTSSSKEINNPQHIGYQKLFSLIPRLIMMFILLKIISRVTLRKFLIWTSILSSVSWLVIGLVVYVVHPNAIWSSLMGGVAEALVSALAVSLGYEFVSRVTTLNTRSTIFVIFNSVTYGLGGIIFVFINTFLSKLPLFGIAGSGGAWVWIIMSIAVFAAILILIFAFKEPEFLTREIDDHTFDKTILKVKKI